MDRWRNALGSVSNITGWVHFSTNEGYAPQLCELHIAATHTSQSLKAWLVARSHGSEAQLVSKVLGKLLRKLRPRERPLTGYEVGLEEQVARVKQALVGSKVVASLYTCCMAVHTVLCKK